MAEFSGDQVHAATPARREQATRDGDVAKSFELVGAIQSLAAIGVGFLMLGGVAQWVRRWTIDTWKNAQSGIAFESEAATLQLQETAFAISAVTAPVLLVVFVAGVLAHLGQSGFLFRAQSITPELRRVGPGKWWRHVFSMNAITLPFIGMPKALIAAATGSFSVWLQADSFFGLSQLPIEQIGPQMLYLVLSVCLHVALLLIALSSLDYGIQRWSFERRIRMTDQELRDESRMQNGDPQITNQRKAMHRSLGQPGID